MTVAITRDQQEVVAELHPTAKATPTPTPRTEHTASGGIRTPPGHYPSG